MPTYEYQCSDCGVIEIFHGIKEDPHTVCPCCKKSGMVRLISGGSGVIIAGREANQFDDIKYAKYWRDKNGMRHRVTPQDGSSKSATIKKQTVSPEEVQRRIKQERENTKRKRTEQSYRKYVRKATRKK